MESGPNTKHPLPHVAIIGAGIGGIKSAIDLARTQHQVTLIDQSPAIGGALMQLDYQFPNNHCGICRLLPMTEREIGTEFCLRKGVLDKNIQLLANTRVVEITGNQGAYQLDLEYLKTGLDPDKCIACGECIQVCPVQSIDSFNESLATRKAIFLPHPYVKPGVPVIDSESCTKCGECQKVCPTKAIHLDFEDERHSLNDISAIITATGFESFKPESQDVYETKTLKNVLTGMQFERLISSSNINSKIAKPSDGKPIKKIAWVQCVGSRNLTLDADFCSSACCMIALKETMLVADKLGSDVKKDVFYMDMRTFGRDYQIYRDKAEKDHHVNFIRCRIHSIEKTKDENNLVIEYLDEHGTKQINEYDLVVLSTGQSNKPLISKSVTVQADPSGIFALVGESQLFDISDTIKHSLSAISKVQQITTPKKQPEPSKADSEGQFPPAFIDLPNLGLIVIDEGLLMNDENWQKSFQALNSNISLTNSILLTSPSLTEFENQLQDQTLSLKCNRILVCSSNPGFLDQCRLVYLKKSILFQNIPVQFLDLSQYYKQTKADLNSTAIQYLQQDILTGLQNLKLRKPNNNRSIHVNQHALILGAGPAGLSAAKTLADSQIKVTLVEKTSELGGNVKFIYDKETKEKIQTLITEVEQNLAIDIKLNAVLTASSGQTGQFLSKIETADNESSILHGAMIIATGGESIQTPDDLYGKHDNIITHNELEACLSEGRFSTESKRIVMIQCVGSREGDKNYCSKTCCVKNLKNAIAIRESFPDTEVYVFYRDIMAYGHYEKFYTKARRAGVIFLAFNKENKPNVTVENEKLQVSGYDPVMASDILISADLLVLATGIMPYLQPELTDILNLKTDIHHFIVEADYKWRPVDTNSPGVFVAGLVRNPVNAEEAILEGEAAAQRAFQVLQKPVIETSDTTVMVNNFLCTGCRLCILDCPYQARYLDPEKGIAAVDIAACQGCGSCAAVCPNNASSLSNYQDTEILNSIENILIDYN